MDELIQKINETAGIQLELRALLIEIVQGVSSASSASYDNTTSGLTATSVQGAIDELAAAAGG